MAHPMAKIPGNPESQRFDAFNSCLFFLSSWNLFCSCNYFCFYSSTHHKCLVVFLVNIIMNYLCMNPLQASTLYMKPYEAKLTWTDCSDTFGYYKLLPSIFGGGRLVGFGSGTPTLLYVSISLGNTIGAWGCRGLGRSTQGVNSTLSGAASCQNNGNWRFGCRGYCLREAQLKVNNSTLHQLRLAGNIIGDLGSHSDCGCTPGELESLQELDLSCIANWHFWCRSYFQPCISLIYEKTILVMLVSLLLSNHSSNSYDLSRT
jgi:hypothetical protein